MKKVLLILTFFFSLRASAQLLFKLSADTLKTFVYAEGDEFDSDQLNTNYWKSAWTKANMAQNFRYNEANVKLKDGLVNFVMRKQDSVYRLQPHEIDSAFLKEKKISVQNYTYALNYSAGMIITKKKLHYGLYELKFKVEEGKGVWPAFWFYGGNKNDEIDVFELKGEKNDLIHVDMHCPAGCDRGYKNKLGFSTNYGGWLPVSDYLHSGFNIMLLEWKENEIIWYVNGHPLAYFKGQMPNAMNLFLNTQVAANGRAFSPGPDNSTVFPNNFYVDYLRIWKEIPFDSVPLLEKKEAPVISPNTKTIYTTKPVSKKGLMYQRKKFRSEEGLVSLALAPNGKITVLVLGKLSQGSTIQLQGKTKTYFINDLSSENEFSIDENETQLELQLKTNKKEYKKTFLIPRQVISLPGG